MNPQVAVVIANWNGRHLLPECLASLAGQTFRAFETIVVDNGSRDGSLEWLAECAPGVRVIRNDANLGFAAANNQGIRASSAPLVATLNNDAVPDLDWLGQLVSAADKSGKAGMFACKIVLRHPAGAIDSAGIQVDRAGTAWNRGWGQADGGQHDVPADVFGPSAAAGVYRRAMLDQIGLFDEDFFAYYEDVDLAWRAQWAGWCCRYVPAARVQHIHSATGVQGSAFKRRLLARNKWWTVLKNYPFGALARYVPAMALIDLGAMLMATLTDRSLSSVRGRWAALRGARRMWRRRREVQRHAQGPIDWLGVLSPVRLTPSSTHGQRIQPVVSDGS